MNAHKSYGRRRPVLRGAELEVAAGEFLVLVGPSGAGKSTLLRVAAGLESLDQGRVEYGGDPDGASGRPAIGVVFQQPSLLPWLTVAGNIRLGTRYRANAGTADRLDVDGLLDRLGLPGLAGAWPDALSGGQAQRVAFARAVAIRPSLLLLDEPFSALDPANRRELREWLHARSGDLAPTIVLVTHDCDEALYLGDRIALLDGSGGIAEIWDNTPGDPATPDAGRTRDGLREEILGRYRLPAVTA
ncbi:nitrate ABC transporter ATP-binding protein [Actinomadura sp. NBRC 104412]|uniref:ABC transporter ATP-binding protein n=1 Tax=Actinomadura sp. NBRC 104412 TaxID=3032203 RepID=UPI00249FD4D0|nr:ATP-binding cassette domain-containing protein [Actinomadura sp. NBRC 104412]GLZ06517.1 nitrate ABC transporter ATP-binding protein [Actinomadura sp. NBRC 104412]